MTQLTGVEGESEGGVRGVRGGSEGGWHLQAAQEFNFKLYDPNNLFLL